MGIKVRAQAVVMEVVVHDGWQWQTIERRNIPIPNVISYVVIFIAIVF